MKKISYHYRMYIEVACIAFGIFLFCGIFAYTHEKKILKNSMESSTGEMAVTLHTRLDDRLTRMDDITKALQSNEELRERITRIPDGKENYFFEHPAIKTELNNMILSGIVSEKLGTNIHLVTRYLDYMGVYMRVTPYARLQITKENLKSFETIIRGLEGKDYVIYVPPHDDKWTLGKDTVFSVIRPIRDAYHIYGVMEISQGTRELKELMALEGIEDGYFVAIVDENKNIVWNSDLENSLSDDILSGMEEPVQYLSNNLLLCRHTSTQTGWTLVVGRTLSGLHAQTKSLRNMLLAVFGITFLFVLLFLFAITRSLTKPLRELKNKLYALSIDEEIHLNVEAPSNEVLALTSGIEEILNQMQEKNRMMVEMRKRAIKAQLDQVEAQMSPHFLYNALSVIGCCGMEDGSDRTYQMCCGLADLLRYSINYEHNLVLMSKEIQCVENYLLIMKMRYEELVEVHWNVDETITDSLIPKLAFQPIIENCFKHGFKKRVQKWKLEISIWKEKDCWRLRVRNNGEPFDPREINKARKRYTIFVRKFSENNLNEAEEVGGLGLENTLKRLYIQYGESAYWAIKSDEAWTSVEIGGKIIEENQDFHRGG